MGVITIAALGNFVGSYQIGWQLAWVFLILALIPGYYLAKSSHETVEDADEIQLPNL